MQRSGPQDRMVSSSRAEAWYEQPGNIKQGLCPRGCYSRSCPARLQVARTGMKQGTLLCSRILQSFQSGSSCPSALVRAASI